MPRFGRPYGYGGGFGYDFAAQLRREEERAQRELLRELQRMAAGSRRRLVELERFGKFVPAGEWDADCEAWPEKSYTWSVGAFQMEICRGPTHAWNGYVTLPAGYPNREKHYDFWNNTYTSGLPKPPVRELTYGNAESFSGPVPVGKFGFDHSWGSDRQPMVLKSGTAGNHDGCVYTTAERAVAEVWRLAAYFASLALDSTLRPTAEWMAEHRESLLKIVEQDMRIADDINKKRRAAAAAAAEAARIAAEKAAAEAAEAARIAAEKAAAEAAERARLAAEEAERQRLWDEAHPEEAAIREAEKRAAAAASVAQKAATAVTALQAQAAAATRSLREEKEKAAHAQEKIAAAEALEARRDAREELLARETRQINHLPQLRTELRNLKGRIYERETDPTYDFTERIAATSAPAAEAQAAYDAAQAEVQQLKDAWAAKQKATADLAAAKAEKEEKQKRLDRVNQLIGQIDALKTRREAGETLDPLQAKKIGRRPVLAKEKAELEAAQQALILRICPQAQKTGSRCPGFVLCFTCMSPEEIGSAAASQWR
jgi:hypothetical protein